VHVKALFSSLNRAHLVTLRVHITTHKQTSVRQIPTQAQLIAFYCLIEHTNGHGTVAFA